MKSTLLKRSLIAGAVVATSVVSYIPMISAASADSVQTAAGSDTTENVMGAILRETLPAGITAAYNVPVYSTSNFEVPGDANCPTITFSRTVGASPIPSPVAPGIAIPNGSGAGRTALKNYVANTKRYTAGAEVASGDAGFAAATPVKGCVDIARSSSYSAASPNAFGEYYAFALDAVSWATTSQLAPSTLTPAQLKGIYDCSYTDWSQVGGSAGPIQRYLPPDTSGTFSFFKSDLIGGYDATTVSNANCPTVKRVDKNNDPFEENRGDKIPSVDFQKAIFPYSAGQWVYQANNAANPTIDQRQVAGSGFYARLGGINNSGSADGTTKLNNANDVAWNTTDAKWQLNDAGLSVVQSGAVGGYPVVEANATMYTSGATYATVANRGIRYVYNVLASNAPSYDDSVKLVGFDNSNAGAKSPLCSGTHATIISTYGFSPLPSTVNNTFNIAGSNCRKFAA